MIKYDIYYNDGVYYGSMTFNSKDKKEIEEAINNEIERNNNNPNPMYHIKINNFELVQ
ncbi:MAG: hypothetical protein ACOCRK_07430 [bacterium]